MSTLCWDSLMKGAKYLPKRICRSEDFSTQHPSCWPQVLLYNFLQNCRPALALRKGFLSTTNKKRQHNSSKNGQPGTHFPFQKSNLDALQSPKSSPVGALQSGWEMEAWALGKHLPCILAGLALENFVGVMGLPKTYFSPSPMTAPLTL